MRISVRVLPLLAIAALAASCGAPADSAPAPPTGSNAPAAGAVRFTGTLEAIRSRTITAPRMSGSFAAMIITTLAKPGTRVKEGDLLVEFDPQEQQRLASDKRAEVVDLGSQIDRKRGDQAAEEAKERTGLVAAENDIARARLAVGTNELVAKIAAEKNNLMLEQSLARFEQLKTTFELKRRAAAADLRILEIRRERAERALGYAEQNATRMQIRAPFAGLVVVKTKYRGETPAEIIEGDDVRPGQAIVEIVDTSAMQVRARVNQADAQIVKAGMPATIRLDGFPELSFTGRVERVTPVATSGMSSTVRTFTALIAVEGSHPQLLPDLTASVEILLPEVRR